MESDHQYAQRQVRQFKADSVAQIVAPGLGNSKLLVSRLQRNAPEHGFATPAKPDAVFSILVQLKQQDRRELYLEDKLVHQGIFPKRAVSVVNHWQRPKANLLSAFDTIIFTVPQAALNEVTEDQRIPAIEALVCEHEGRIDDTIWSLTQSLMPALEHPDEVGTLYAERVLLACTTYFAHAFGGMRPAEGAAHLLSPTEAARAMDLMDSEMQNDLSMSTVASEFNRSRRHFMQSFRRTVGATPDSWMRQRRIEHAQTMMRRTSMPIAEVAALCGFASKKHFLREFIAVVGMSPETWRKLALN